MKGYDIFKAIGDTEEKYIDMSESHRAPKKSQKAIKIAFAAAAAAVLTVGIGAYTYSRFNNPESVEMYLQDPDMVAAVGSVVNQVMENEHVRITVDTVLSDGYQAYVLVTLDALDDFGKNYINYRPSIRLRRSDTGERVLHSGGGSMHDWTEQVKNDTVRYYHTIFLTDLETDLSADIEIIFFSLDLFSQEEWEEGKPFPLDENMIPVGNSLGYDFIATVNFTKNVETVELTGSDGQELTLSQFELVSKHENINEVDRDSLILDGIPEVALIRNDGTREEPDPVKMFGGGNEWYSTLFLGKFIDLDEYSGVEIDGVEYLKA